MRRIVAVLLVAATVVGLAGCRQEQGQTTAVDRGEGYDRRSQMIYDEALGGFYDAYQYALDAPTVSDRYARMAVAEAKLLGSGVMLPLTAGGGSYTISRVAPYTAPYALWGNDAERLGRILVTDRPIGSDHVEQLRQQWARRKGTGSFAGWAADFLTEQGYVLQDTHRRAYTSDPKTWDVLATSRSADQEAIVNTYEGLYAYDCEGMLRPALAEKHFVTQNEDGTVSYTFTLKKGLNWVDPQGRVVAAVVADDFVAGAQHMMDARGGLEYLVEGLILGASEYIRGETTDFSKVGVRALDERTLEYTLVEDVPYFLSMLGYGVFAPMSRSFYRSRGGRFGSEFDESSPSYTYGKSPDDIAYCGPYLVTNATAKNTIVFSANPSYWGAKELTMKSIVWRWYDGSDPIKLYEDAISGAVDGVGLDPATLQRAKEDGVFKSHAHIASRDATTYVTFHNLDRQAVANFNDGGAATRRSAEEVARTSRAMRNIHFRRALCFAVDRGACNAQVSGEALKENALRNTFTPGNFVTLAQEVTVGSRTYAAGTAYGEILQDALTDMGLTVRVWDPEAESGLGSSDGFDGWYDPKAAAAELAIAARELQITEDDPIVIDLPYFSGSEERTNRANAYKQSVEQALGGSVQVDLIGCPSADQVHYAGYYIGVGSEANYDVYDLSGWGPDYGDPQTYLSAMLPGYEGYLTRMLGIF